MQSADTNILIRALIHDPSAPEQCEAAAEWLAGLDAVFVPQLVQAELAWWMRRYHALRRDEIRLVLSSLLEHPAVHLQARDAFEYGVKQFEAGGDFADALIAFEAHRADAPLVTFDRKLARSSGVTLLRVARAR